MERYHNREEAGQILAKELSSYTGKPQVLVLALPRGGVPVAYEIAKNLGAPLDVFIVRKLGVPGQEELAMGAVAMDGTTVLNDGIIRDLRISPDAIKRVSHEEQQEIERRILAYRGTSELPLFKDKIIILVDDGIATGATIRAAVNAIKKAGPAKIIIAVPVADKAMCERLAEQVDQVICPLRPLYFHAVGAWYDDFEQTTDEEVRALLKRNRS